MRAPLLATLVALTGLVILLALALWQFSRAQDKQTLLEEVERSQGVLPLAQIQFDHPLPAAVKVEVDGHFDPTRSWLLDNRIYQGKVGYEGIGLFNTNQGLLLVNTGWIEAGKRRDTLPSFSLPSTWLTLQGFLAVPKANPFVIETPPESGWPSRIQEIDIDKLSQQIQQPLLPAVVHLRGEHSFAGKPLWQPVVMPPEKHLAYAAQWLGLAVAWCVIFYLAVFKPRNKESS